MKTHKFQVILAVIIGDLLSCEMAMLKTLPH